MGDGDVRDGHGLGKGKEDIPTSLDPDAGAICGGASAADKAGEAAEGRLQGGGDAGPVQETAQNLFDEYSHQESHYL